jgi:hypothetical protein
LVDYRDQQKGGKYADEREHRDQVLFALDINPAEDQINQRGNDDLMLRRAIEQPAPASPAAPRCEIDLDYSRQRDAHGRLQKISPLAAVVALDQHREAIDKSGTTCEAPRRVDLNVEGETL